MSIKVGDTVKCARNYTFKVEKIALIDGKETYYGKDTKTGQPRQSTQPTLVNTCGEKCDCKCID